jgi:hypothetical protein
MAVVMPVPVFVYEGVMVMHMEMLFKEQENQRNDHQ